MNMTSLLLVPSLSALLLPALDAADQTSVPPPSSSTSAPGGTPAPSAGSSAGALPSGSTITVVGQGDPFAIGLSGSATKTALPDQDYPQSTTTLSRQDLNDLGDHSLHDALMNVPGLTMAAGEGRTTGDQFYIRGFPATTDIYLDGQKDNGYYLRDTFDVAEIQVLRGPSALLFGPGATGGAVNLITNKPTDHWTANGDITGGSYDLQRVSAGVGGPLAGDTLGMRLDAFGESSDSYRDDQHFSNWGAAPSLALHFDTGTTALLQVMHQSYNGTSDYGVPFLYGRPAPVNPGTYYGFKDDNFQESSDTPTTLTVQQELGKNAYLTNATRYAYYQRTYRADIPTQVSYPAGTFAARQILCDNVQRVFDNTTEFHDKGTIAGQEATLLVGFESMHTYYQFREKNSTGLPTINVLDPNYPDTAGAGRADNFDEPLAVYFHSDTSQLSGYAIGTMQLGDQWLAILGGRYDNYTSSYHSGPTTSPVITELDETNSQFSPRAGLVYTPIKPLSFYVSYSTSFDPSAETYTLSAATDTLPPEKTRNIEVGSKATLGQGLEVYADVFDMTMYNARTTNPQNPTFQDLAGTQRTLGIEAGGDGHLTDAWTVSGGIAYYDAEIIESSSTTTNYLSQTVSLQGKEPINTPRTSGTLWTTYRLPVNVYGGIGIQATSHVYADPADSNVIPGYVIANAMVGYDMRRWGALWHVQLNVDNLFDTHYYQGASQNNPYSVLPAPPITGELNLGAAF